MTYASYTIGQDDIQPEAEAPREAGPQVRNRDAATFVSISNGSEFAETVQTHDVGRTSELNPYHGTDSILATARHPQGLVVDKIVATTLIEVDGIQANAEFWAREGLLQKNADGTFSESATKPTAAAPQVVDASEVQPVSNQDMSTINSALADVGQESLDMLAAVGMGVAVGRLDESTLLHKFSQASGHDNEESSARLTAITSAYRLHADRAIESRYGIPHADLPAFYQWARANQQGQLQVAVQRQLDKHDVSGYRSIATAWKAANPPSAAAMKAAGLPVRMLDQRQEVFVKGNWMSSAAAARAGFI